MKPFHFLGLASALALLTTIHTSASVITWTGNGTFTSDSVLALAGTTANEVYGVSFPFSAANTTTANGYTFANSNFSFSSGVSNYGGFIYTGSTGDAGLDAVVTNGVYGNGFTGMLTNLTPNTSYTVLTLAVDTRGTGTQTFYVNDGTSNSIAQLFRFGGGSPAMGSYLLGTFTTGSGQTTQSFTQYETGGTPGDLQYNAILLELSPVVATPEPSTYALLGCGLMGMAIVLRVRKLNRI